MSYTVEHNPPMQHNTMAYCPVMETQTLYDQNQVYPTMHPGVSGPSPMEMCNMFASGYTDCAREAIRYLVEVEGLPYDHPLVIGLHHHLYEQQRIQGMKYLLQNMMSQQQYTDNSSPRGHETTHSPTLLGTHTNEDEGIERNSIVSNKGSAISNELEGEVSVNVQSCSDQSLGLSEHTEQLVTELAEEIMSMLEHDRDGDSDYEFDDDHDDTDEGFDEIDY